MILDAAGKSVYVQASRLGLAHVVVSRNESNFKGGGLYLCEGASATMVGCRILDNVTDKNGPGVYLRGASAVTMTGCVVARNSTVHSTGVGGGIYLCQGSTALVRNCTVAANSTAVGGDAVYVSGGAVATLLHDIFWGNGPGAFLNEPSDQGTISATYSDIQGDTVWAGTGNINTDPMFADTAAGDYSLLPGSPCIDAGDPASLNDPDGTRAEMGAFFFDQSKGPIIGTIPTITWHAGASPYRIVGRVLLPLGNTLTIDPGVDVVFDADVQFVVRGRLAAIGTETDSIRFIEGAAEQWRGLRFGAGDSSTLHYARISDGDANGYWIHDCQGGAINVAGIDTRVELRNSVLSGNSAFDAGGGLFARYMSAVTIEDCIIRDNAANYYGGGIHADNAAVTVTRSVIDGNSAAIGGAVYARDTAEVALTNCTITGNDALAEGSGPFSSLTAPSIDASMKAGGAFAFTGATLALHNTILWGNSPIEMANHPVRPGAIVATFCDIEGGYGAEADSNVSADPLFVDSEQGDYHLMYGSPAIDAGDPTSALDPDTTRADIGAIPFDHRIESPPVWLARPALAATVGEALTFVVAAADPNGDALSYSAPLLPSGAAFDGESRTFAWTPAPQQRGEALAVFGVSDGSTAVLDSVRLHVAASPTSIADASQPLRTELRDNFPNPFNPATTIRYAVAHDGPISIVVWNMAGQQVRTVVDGPIPTGYHSVVWDGRDATGREVSSGVYLYRLTSAKGSLVRKMLLLR